MCDNCGLKISRADWITKQIWFDFVKLKAREEVRRISAARRQKRDIKNYESDGA
jgi:hypothetical protein